ncbi:MAG: ATP-binding protein, partial [Methanotrichaceae archaeon]
MILEDNDSDFELIKRELHNIDLNNTIEWAHDKGTFLQALDTFAPNIILLDYSLPGFDGLSALSLVRQRFPDIPAIIVSGAIGEEIAIETLKAGATDYVLKQRLNRLRPVVHRALQESEQLIERKRMEEELKWHSELLDLAPVLVLDMDGRIILWNTGAEEMYGWTKGEAIGSVSHDLLKTEFPMPLEEIMAELMENGHWRGELSHIKHDGSHISVSSHWILHRDSQGKPIAILEINNDITDLKFAEDELKKARDELELRVQERTAELVKTNEELLNAKEVAEEAVKAKAAFLANMSHELRTPMNSIIGFTSLLLMEPLPPEYKDWLDNMRMNGEALLALINDVLDFSKMEKEMIVLELHPFDLRHRIEESLDLVSTKAADKGLDLAYIMDINVPETIIGDSARLRQVLANLLSNAVKFTDTGDVLVHVSSKREGDIHEVHFAVQDTGIGMPQEQMNKLFQPFSQISLAPSRLNEGTGLGLAISKKLVELMGGKIWAQSEVGKGSTFIFTIKAKAATEDSVTKLPDGPQLQLAKRNILIVDDNPTMRRLLGRQTKTWGMVPLVASLSYSAIELIQKGITPEVAIIDASMPDLDGIVLAEKIHSLRSDLPLIILTSAGQHIPQDLPAVSLTKP